MNDPIQRALALPARPLAAARGSRLTAAFDGLVRFGFDATVLPILFCAVAGYFGASAWLFDITNSFRPHTAVLALGLMVFALLSRSAVRMITGVAIFVAAAVPLVLPPAPAAATAASGNFRVLNANVMGGKNADMEDFKRLVAEVQPDIVVVEEAVSEWHETLRSLPGLPYVSGPDLPVYSTVLVASRYPTRVTQVPLRMQSMPNKDVGGGMPLRVEVDRPGASRPLIVYAIHPPTPRSWIGWTIRNGYLDEIAMRAAKNAATSDVIVSGDWNTPSWSPFFRDFFHQTGMRATEASAWPKPTRIFREFGAPNFLGSPIDHIAVTPDIGVASFAVGREFGSDHLPVIADLALPF